MRKWTKPLLVLGVGALALPLTATAAGATTSGLSRGPVVVVSGLNNPRQLDLVHNDVLLVAEAGKGGTLATISDPEEGNQGIGLTGSITAVLGPAFAQNQHPFRIVTGLLSAAAVGDAQNPPGSGAVGSDGVSARTLNRLDIQETLFPPNVLPKNVAAQNGQLLVARPGGAAHPVADIAGFEAQHNPDHQAIDSDPYAVLRFDGYQLVADAAANDVLKVTDSGHISVFRVFPNIRSAACLAPENQQPAPNKPGCQFVPTSLATDRWGHIYVGALAGLVPGQGQVVELSSDGEHNLNRWTGLTSVTGVAIDRTGALIVSQLFAPEQHPVNPIVQGVVTRISGSHRTNVDVPFPAGLAVDNFNNVYVSAFSILPDTGAGIPGLNTSGQVWRMRF